MIVDLISGMEQRESFLTRLGKQTSSDVEGGPTAALQADKQLMPPPHTRLAGPRPPAGKRTVQQQAMLAAAAAHSSTGPLGTIPDDGPFDASEQCSNSASASSSGSTQYAISSWRDYFDSMQDLNLSDRGGAFRVYQAGSQGPVVFFLHGGGYSGLTWALLAKQLKGIVCLPWIKEATAPP